MSISVVFLIVALIFFAFGGWSRWWASPQPYYPTLISGGLFFWVLSILWPMIGKQGTMHPDVMATVWRVVSGGAAALVLSAAARALPDPLPLGSRFYLFFYRFAQIMLANFDKSHPPDGLPGPPKQPLLLMAREAAADARLRCLADLNSDGIRTLLTDLRAMVAYRLPTAA